MGLASTTLTPQARMFKASRLGDLLALHDALQSEPDLIESLYSERNALMWAAEHGQVECVEYLLSLSHPALAPNRATSYGTNALMFAAYNSHIDCVRALIPVTDTALATLQKTDALAHACLSLAHGADNMACVEALLEVCDPTLPGQRGMDALSLAAESGNARACSLLLSRCDPNRRDQGGCNALSVATQAARLSCIEIIAPACSFESALSAFKACLERGRVDVGESLLGARPDLLTDPKARAFKAAASQRDQLPAFHAMLQARSLALSEMSALSSATTALAPRGKGSMAQRAAAHPRAAAHRL